MTNKQMTGDELQRSLRKISSDYEADIFTIRGEFMRRVGEIESEADTEEASRVRQSIEKTYE